MLILTVLATGYILGYTLALYFDYKALKEELKCQN